MTTALDIITDAVRMLGVYASNETLTDADAEVGLTRLNDMLDSWSNESLSCFAILEQSGSLQVGVSQYSIGLGGTFNLTRPIRLIDGPGSAYLQDSNGNNYSLNVVPRDQWNMIGNRSGTVTSNFPDTLFYDPQYPLGLLNFFPVPNLGGITAFWDSYAQLTEFSTLSTSASFPPGYLLALKTNLAVHLKPYFTSAVLDPDVRAQAMESKGNIKRSNIRPVQAGYDAEIVSRGTATYNPYSDSVSGGVR